MRKEKLYKSIFIITIAVLSAIQTYLLGEISVRVVIFSIVFLYACIFFSYTYGYFGAAFASSSCFAAGIMCTIYFLRNDIFVFFTVGCFFCCNAFACILIAYLSEINAKKEKILIKLSQTDFLTNVYNHRYFQKKAHQIFNLCKASSKKMSLIAIDVDNFKKTNDFFGHLVGDQILINISEIINASIRSEDMVFRYGGDEFMVILPECGLEESTLVCERILEKIKEYRNPDILKVMNEFQITVSMGISCFPDLCDDYKVLIHQADMAMFESKYFGKNRYTVYDEWIDSPSIEFNGFKSHIKPMLLMTNLKDNYTYGHSIRTSKLVYTLGKALCMTEIQLEKLKLAGLMYDVGKSQIAESILNKKEKLTLNEIEKIKEHPEKSVEIIRSVVYDEDIIEAIKSHHEKYDGTGYPSGLAGEDISLYARILSIADAYDAMRSPKVYSPEMNPEQALLEIKRYKGIQFDPGIADKFIEMIKDYEKDYGVYMEKSG